MRISEGVRQEIYEKQIKAIKQIRENMRELNDEVIDSLERVNTDSMGFPPSIWVKNTGKKFTGDIEIFNKNIGEIIPICYGDVVQRDDEKEFVYYLGDDLMYRLSIEIPEVNYTIFLLGDVDGVMDQPPENLDAKLVSLWKKNDFIRTSHNSEIDVTGGMDLKLIRASEIAKKVDNVWFINGNYPERIIQLIRTGSTIGLKLIQAITMDYRQVTTATFEKYMSDAVKHLEKHDPTQSEMMEEMCLLVDKEDNVIGTMSKLDCHYEKVIDIGYLAS